MGPASTSNEGRMARTVRVFVLGLVVGSTGIPTAMAQSSETPTIRLVVVNTARVPQEILEGAQLEATRIYAGVGVTLAWVDTAAIATQSTQETHQPSSSLRLTISIVSNPIAGTKDSGGKLMGLELQAQARAAAHWLTCFTSGFRCSPGGWRLGSDKS